MITTQSLWLNDVANSPFLWFIIDLEYRLYNLSDIVEYSNTYSQSFEYSQSKEIIDYLILNKYQYPLFYNAITQSTIIDDEYLNISNSLLLNIDSYTNNIQLSKYLKLNNTSFKKISKNRHIIYTKYYDMDFTMYPWQLYNGTHAYVQYRYPGVTLDDFKNKKIKIIRHVSRHIKNWDVIHPRNHTQPFLYWTVRTPYNPTNNLRYQYTYDCEHGGHHQTFAVHRIGLYNIIPNIYNKFLIYENNESNSLQLYFSGCLPASNYNLQSYYNNMWSTIPLHYNYSTQSLNNYSMFSASAFLIYRPQELINTCLLGLTNERSSYYSPTLNMVSNLIEYTMNLAFNPASSFIDLIYNHTDRISTIDDSLRFMHGCGYYTVSFLFRLLKYHDTTLQHVLTLYNLYANSNINNLEAINTIKSLPPGDLPLGIQWMYDCFKLILVPYNALATNLKYLWRKNVSMFNNTLFYNKFIKYSGNQYYYVNYLTGLSSRYFSGGLVPGIPNIQFIGSHILTKSVVPNVCMLDTIGQFCNIVNDNKLLASLMPENKSYFEYWYDLKLVKIELSSTFDGFYKTTYIIYKKFNDSAKIGIGLKPPVYKLRRQYNLSQYNEYTLYDGVSPYDVNLTAWGGDFYLQVEPYTSSNGVYTANLQYYTNSNYNMFYKVLDFYGFLLKTFSIEKADII